MKTKMYIAALMAVMVMGAKAQQNQTYLNYIDEWKATAVQQQADYGIPASITMAQALLESGAGQSELAVNANNHFGIKCSDNWMGGVYYYDDDRKHECFRKYGDAAESFRDHSLFLQRPRYTTCYEIAIEDYEGWAYRLKECGYATDPRYAPKLIKLIEDYRLDTLAAVSGERLAVSADEPEVLNEGEKVAKERRLKAVVVHRNEPIMVIHNDPEPEYVVPLSARQERDSFLLMHPKKRCNGIAYVEAREGDTYANVAFRLNVRERELREHNDALGRDLSVGDRIYLSTKKNTGVNAFVWTHPGQSLWQLSQEEAIHIEAIQKINDLHPTIRTFRTRQKLYLKNVKDEK